MIEEALCSRGRIRILYLLTRVGALNLTRIARDSKLSVEMTKRHLRRLSELGIISELRLGRFKFYELERKHPLAEKIISLFSEVSLYTRD